MMGPGHSVAVLGVLALVALAGCVAQPQPQPVAQPVPASAERLEYMNMRLSHRVPKSSSRQLVSAFETYCLANPRNRSVTARRLRAADYVVAPRQAGDSATAFVVDDRRPMVTLSDDGRFCAVVAEARTGQSQRIASMVRTRLRDATEIGAGGAADTFTLAIRAPFAGIVALRRIGVDAPESRLILGVQRTN